MVGIGLIQGCVGFPRNLFLWSKMKLWKGGYRMQKLANDLLTKMIDAHLTGYEIDFVLYISKFQNVHGVVPGVYYKEVMAALGLSTQQFYNIKKSLIEKGIIKSEKKSYYDHDITLVGNDSTEKGYLQRGYINTNKSVLTSTKFKNLKPNAKLMALDLIKITETTSKKQRAKSFKIAVKKLYDKYKNFFGVTERVVRRYLKELKELFTIGIKDHLYYITPKSGLFDREQKTEIVNENENEIRTICRRKRVNTDQDSITSVAKLIEQYRSTAKNLKKDILDIVHRSIERSIDKRNQSKSKPGKFLKPKLVHVWIRALLNL